MESGGAERPELNLQVMKKTILVLEKSIKNSEGCVTVIEVVNFGMCDIIHEPKRNGMRCQLK